MAEGPPAGAALPGGFATILGPAPVKASRSTGTRYRGRCTSGPGCYQGQARPRTQYFFFAGGHYPPPRRNLINGTLFCCFSQGVITPPEMYIVV
jgi:hypothetical protein